MAPQSVPDAAAISPYPFVVRQGRGPTSAPENDDRGPHPKGKKAKARRPERNRQDEEPRFNIGPPRNPRNAANRQNRRGFLNRLPGQWYPEDPNVPDYPPPSFQEAMTTPPVSVCSSTTSLVPQPMAPLVIPENIPELSEVPTETEAAPAPEDISTEITPSDDTTDSDESFSVIDPKTVPVGSTDIPKAPSRLKSDWRKLRGTDFLHKSSRESSNKHDDEKPKLHRIRTIVSPKVPIDIDPDMSMAKFNPQSPIYSPKRKLVSLSPLKTMFPRSPLQQDRETLSALPSPSSPYPTSRSVFFRSSTSLATASFLRLPLLSSMAGHKNENRSRKFFKGKERVRDPESIDTWEVLNEDAYEGIDTDGNETVSRHRSLMIAVESFKNPAVPPVARIQRPVSEVISADKITADRRAFGQLENGREVEDFRLSHSAQEAAMRDWRNPTTLFIDRPLNRGRPTMPTSSENPERNAIAAIIPTSSTATLSPGPPLTMVRVRAKSPSPQPPSLRHVNQGIHLSPLRIEATSETGIGDTRDEETMYQRALDTPLPATPLYHNHFDQGENTTGERDTDFLPTSDHQIPNLLTDSDSTSAHTPAKMTISIHPRTEASLEPPSVQDTMSPTRHHYVGRPLPRPPAPPVAVARTAVIDSIYAPPEELGVTDVVTEQSAKFNNPCPEGLLIDLEDTSLDSAPGTGTCTPLANEGPFHSVSLSPASSSAADLLQLVSPPQQIDSTQGASSPNATHLDQALPKNDTAEVTDLDPLMLRRESRPTHGSGSGPTGWREQGFNKALDLPFSVRSHWTRQTLIPHGVLPNRHLQESQPQRQYVAHWAH